MTDEEAAIKHAYTEQIGVAYNALLTVIIMNGNVEEACQRFKVGLKNARRAMDLALKMVSET